MTRDAFPPLRELPAMFLCYALVAGIWWLIVHAHEASAFVARLIGG